jgi:DNA-binding transcriptional regulator YiaG
VRFARASMGRNALNLGAFKPSSEPGDMRGRKQDSRKEWRHQRIKELRETRPEMSRAEMAILLGVSLSTLQADITLLNHEGSLNRNNG